MILTKYRRRPVPVDFLHSLTPSGLHPHLLLLKVDCVVMLLKNLDLKAGLTNGVGSLSNTFTKMCWMSKS